MKKILFCLGISLALSGCTKNSTFQPTPSSNNTNSSVLHPASPSLTANPNSEPDLEQLTRDAKINDLTSANKKEITTILQQIFQGKVAYNKKNDQVSVFTKTIDLLSLATEGVRNLNVEFTVYKYYPGASFSEYIDDGGNQATVHLDDLVNQLAAGKTDRQIAASPLGDFLPAPYFKKFGSRLFLVEQSSEPSSKVNIMTYKIFDQKTQQIILVSFISDAEQVEKVKPIQTSLQNILATF